tara:strand:- start:39903 stop:41123 length:1221 start_codon:yes stop_codon:yes gene_type:complete
MMNPSIQKIVNIAKKEERLIIGLMSGTSLDGLDIALCRLKGSGLNTSVYLEEFITKPYSTGYARELKMISSVENVSLSEICYQHTKLAHLHANWILEALKEWGVSASDVDCIASHGQTIYHSPARDQKNRESPINSTLQIGDGDQLAVKTGILTISDFRQKHIAAGGEGAPLAGLVDKILFRHQTEPRILLNIGGIGNFTYLPHKEANGNNSFTTDTGPGNTLIDKLTQHYFDKPFDKDAILAKSGFVENELLKKLHSDPWFEKNESKTTGPEYFSLDWVNKSAQSIGINPDDLPPENIIRTVTELSALTITESITQHHADEKKAEIYVSGGGAHNPLLMSRIQELLPGHQIHNFNQLGVDPDAKEALLFAVLANEMLAGEGFLMSGLKDVNDSVRVNLGKISFPE